MEHNEPMRHTWFIVLLLILIVVSGLGWKLRFLNPLLVSLTAPACSDPVLTTLPTSDENIDSITPLGNISLPNHLLPTEHTYYMFKRGTDGLPLKTEVFSPANLVVERITYISTTRNGQLFDADYKVDIVPCKKVSIQFDHIRTLSPKLASAYAASKPRCQENQRAGDLNQYCHAEINIKLSAGELVGIAGGGHPTGLDFGATDSRQKRLQFANNSRYRDNTRHTVCPYDLFGPAQKTHLYGFLGDSFQRRINEPICGTIAQDVAGGAQGNWYLGKGGSDELERQGKTVALIHDNVDPRLGLIVLGSTFSKVVFSPTHSGLINREFSEVVPSQQIYCYQPDASGSRVSYGTSGQFKGSVLIRLPSASELDVEVRSQDCSGSTAFTNPTRFIR